MLKQTIKTAGLLICFAACLSKTFAQTIKLNYENEFREFTERNDSRHYSCLLSPLSDDSLFAYQSKTYKKISRKNIEFGLFAPETIIRYNGKLPYGLNDGAMIPNKGLQNYSSVGVFLKKGFLSVQLRPELLFAQTRNFPTFPESYDERLWAVRYNLYNQIDNPEIFSNHVKKFYPGQSNIKLSYKHLSTGISSENRWWGPGKYNSILMSNNAPGFVHFFLQTEQPLATKIGRFEFQLIAGNIYGSGEVPPDTNRVLNNVKLYKPKPADDKRYLNGLAFVYQPSFAKGLSLGFGRVFYLYKTDRKNSFDGYLPVFGFLLKNETSNEDDKRRDQLFSLYVKQLFDKGNSNVYLEFSRNDHAWNFRDLISDPFHSRAYIIGINKYYQLRKRKLNINIEVTELSKSGKTNLRETPYWYTHHQVVHGYTNYGQVIGAGIGPGSAMQSVTAEFIKSPVNSFSVYAFRIERNKDFYYDAFLSTREYYRKWVDVVLGFKLNKSFKYFNLHSDINLIRSYNYQWQDNSSSWRRELKDGIDVINLSANIGIQYKL